MIENVYRLQVMNTDEQPHRYRIAVSGIEEIRLVTPSELEIGATESRIVPVTVRVPAGSGQPGPNRVEIELRGLSGQTAQVREKTMFFVPR